jgi:1-deoxy-D-xylulose-5-phosphate reductoisomerase
VKNIAILGSTGSIGTQTLEVIDALANEFKIVALTANKNYKLLAEQIYKYKPEIAVLSDKSSMEKLAGIVTTDSDCRLESGEGSLIEAATWPAADLVVLAQVGFSGFEPLLAALKAGKKVALANKESLVIGGEILKREGLLDTNLIVPVDSEHSAIMQSWTAKTRNEVARIYLTASGGPFFGLNKVDLEKVTPAEALRHPNWKMGDKITIDSATMMNKGLEVIEAKWLFGLELSQIKVVIHRQSIVHSMVEYIDGSTIAQLGLPDMRTPIQYALTYSKRKISPVQPFNPFGKTLSFESPDTVNFPALRLAYRAAESGGTMPTVLNGANEIAVGLFLKGKASFNDIPAIVEIVMNEHHTIRRPEIKDVLEADRWSRKRAMAVRNKSREVNI